MSTFLRNTSLSRSRRLRCEALPTIPKSNSYRRRRAKQRKVFLTTYKLDSFTEPTSPKPKPTKLPALNLKKIVSSVRKLVQNTAASFASRPSLLTYF
ncbi:hypothetical protein Fmac_019301 [Flemingia macrophylla]|uniref:Uncharacterized protein n=1 Tax=Flemingia macrophylla TaxID=520843 RepID=A0ABD1M7K0_9FABA